MAKSPVKGRINEDEIFEVGGVDEEPSTKGKKAPPAYRIYKDAKIPVSKALGPALRAKYDAAIKAYDFTRQAWQEVLAYYNNNQVKGATTSTGHFRRGDSTENVVFSNLNLMIPTVYAKNADFAVNTIDAEDKEFTEALRHLLNALFKRRDYLNAKQKIKKACGMALLTNFGIFKLDYTKKDDSREVVIEEMQKLSQELQKAKTKAEVNAAYGKLLALEAQVQVAERSGPKMEHVYPWHCIVDPNAEDQDGTDGEWMAEPCMISTDYLKARFMEQGEGDEWNLVFKPSHKVAIGAEENGETDSGMGAVMQKLSGEETQIDAYTDEERLAYQYEYMTECVYWWDKVTKRLYLFLKDDWSYPVWVWEDPLHLSRFFPYFNIPFAFSTGGPVSVGETSYYLDQQDEINDINKQVAAIRRIVFKYIFYDSETMTPETAELINRALRGEGPEDAQMRGIAVPEGKKLADMLHALIPPSTQMEALFNKEPVLNTINRISNTSDALRGVQFKTNTNEAAVNSYQDSVRLSVGAKVDSVEDALSDAGHALAELCVQFMDQDEVAGIIGAKLAAGWKNMTVEEFNANYSCEVVAGSTEKQNSTFKKNEAVKIAQAVGQFAQAAPGTTLRIMLRVLQQAFSEVVITPDDWAALEKEVQANLSKGVSDGSAPGGGGGGEMDALRNVPPDVKKKALEMKNAGKSDDEILAFVKQQGQGRPGPQPAQEKQNAA